MAISPQQEMLNKTLEGINKKFGKGAIMVSGDRTVEPIQVISTGAKVIDDALGVGGIPVGRIIEVYGPESSGKTTLTLHCVAEAQKKGMVTAFVDAEHALDTAYAQNLGIDLDKLLISQPASGEEALSIVEDLTASGVVGLIVVDSVAALVPQAELAGEMGDSHMGLQARLMSQALRKITSLAATTKTTIIFINQLRENIGAMGYGPKEVTTGGKALKFYSSVRIDIRRISTTKNNKGESTGNQVRVKITKNKVAPPFKQVELEIVFGKGFYPLHQHVRQGMDEGFIVAKGAWVSSCPELVAAGCPEKIQGKDNVITFFEENKGAYERLCEMLQEVYNPTSTPTYSGPVPSNEEETEDEELD